MCEIDAGMELFEQILETLDDSYWNKDLDEIQLTNRGYVKINEEWITFGWHIAWGVVLSTIQKMDHVPDLSKAFYMRDCKEYKKYQLKKIGDING